ncbi:MAG: hypothetical protein A2W61_05765 [Deltaproteobacteria bacterium RIFCSPLOWO2_01_44_7]|nr:MAG: hypothetical protein A2712_04465 [Deltaproteobacteria bacterium RIFCSPHIGHO2_01_FULL_43_49]OGQ16435.1 MAG: hypothetical protein A3D22_02430 [Deltaproteobacteria bacterium RIFCSPHIGHO2_02_FULL_44_53]OGQ27737.1 MAG: hypothetical protein A3D98_08555 [Deltaproteobacteria bacterium RIFCSPHIGHO2_12_FULL_44_21]OGQ32953.1 MAG: hypothetical protein A2979_10360 [Deltaproteobacteria bacterium RIFCSPLOWO2_01_FULL_45_74]OGQ40405.1 MAG: hypothetical protein A2W61_05765 [Deltaproteobacteria bacterium 
MVLLDTFVWIEFFKNRPSIPLEPLELLLEERKIAICHPIRAEILSGRMTPKTQNIIVRAMEAISFVDLDWNSQKTWDQIADLAQTAERHKIVIPSVVDRMILLSAKESGCQLWTLDKKLNKLATIVGVPLYNPS